MSAYPGILFRFALEGMLDRSGVDLLCLNSQTDLDTYQQGCNALGMDSRNGVLTGLPILWNVEKRQKDKLSTHDRLLRATVDSRASAAEALHL